MNVWLLVIGAFPITIVIAVLLTWGFINRGNRIPTATTPSAAAPPAAGAGAGAPAPAPQTPPTPPRPTLQTRGRLVWNWKLWTLLIVLAAALLGIGLWQWETAVTYYDSFSRANAWTSFIPLVFFGAVVMVSGFFILRLINKGLAWWVVGMLTAVTLCVVGANLFIAAIGKNHIEWWGGYTDIPGVSPPAASNTPGRPCGPFSITVTNVPDLYHPLTSNSCPFITWNIEPGKRVAIYDRSGKFLTYDSHGEYHQLPSWTQPAFFAAVGNDVVGVSGVTQSRP